jgi:hypothetical protein
VPLPLESPLLLLLLLLLRMQCHVAAVLFL